jgi:uncharacterized Zn finger protein (UPF0148 family)
MFCIKCGQSIPDGTVFCPNCGQQQTGTSGSAAPQAYTYQQPAAQVMSPPPQPQAYQAYPAAKPKKKRGCLTAFLIVLAVVIIGAAGVYFLLPGMSKPVDLGIRSSREAYESALKKLAIIKDKSPAKGAADDYSIIYGEPHDVDTSLTSEELTSFFNENRPPYYAVKNVQVRINDDGSIEASATLDTSYVFNEMLGSQYSKKDAQSALPMLGLIPKSVNIYFKAEGGVENNQVEGLSVDAVTVMGIPIPQSLIGDNLSFITNTLDSYIANECSKVGAYISSVEADNGTIDIQGSVPSSIERIPAG